MKKQFLAVLILLISIAAHGQTTKTAHFNSGITTATDVSCKIDTAHALTMEAWVKNDDTTSDSNQHEIFEYVAAETSTSYREIFECFITSNVITFNMSRDGLSNDTNIITINSPLINSYWHHIAITIDNDSTHMFLDGANVANNIGTYIRNFPSNTNIIGIGSNDRSTNMFNGNITNVRISPSVLYTTDFVDTCYYTGSYIYAAMNDINNTDIVVNSSSVATYIPALTNISPCNVSDTTTDTTTTHVLVNNISNDNHISIYPNPCVNVLHIDVTPLSLITTINMLRAAQR